MSNAALYIQVLFVVLGSVAGQGVVFNCQEVALAERVPCGGADFTIDTCKALGCCYLYNYPGVPLCYTKLTRQPFVVIPPLPPQKTELEKLQELCIYCNRIRSQGLLGGLLGTASDILFGDKHPECAPCGRRGLLKRESSP